MKNPKSLTSMLLTIFDKRFAFCFLMMLAIWLLPGPATHYSFLHLLPECVVIFVLGENMKKVFDSLELCVIPVLSVVIVCIVPYLLFYSSRLTVSIFVALIFALLFIGGYVFGKRA